MPRVLHRQFVSWLLGPELGPDSTRTLAWWADSSNGVSLRECYLCNEEFFVPTSVLLEVIAKFKPTERTTVMRQFVADYVPLLVDEHILRPNFAQEMRDQMGPNASTLRRRNMSEEEIGAVTSAAFVLGADAADAKLVDLTNPQRLALNDLRQPLRQLLADVAQLEIGAAGEQP